MFWSWSVGHPNSTKSVKESILNLFTSMMLNISVHVIGSLVRVS